MSDLFPFRKESCIIRDLKQSLGQFVAPEWRSVLYGFVKQKHLSW